MKKRLFLVSILFNVVLWMLSGCYHSDTIRLDESLDIRLISWNVQTFFDAQITGTEYQDFLSEKSPWNEEMYSKRLDKLCKILGEINGDIVVLQEIENQGVLYDILNRLQGISYGKNAYKYCSFAIEPGSAIGCGVISRFPLQKMTIHQIDSKNYGEQPQLRPLMEIDITKSPEKNETKPIMKLFVCHWKSKSGGEAEAKIWQHQQEKLLAHRLKLHEKDYPFGTVPAIICGDFNKDISEFSFSKAENHILIQDIPVKSGWLSFRNTDSEGSYWYQGKWEKIDHFFTWGKVQLKNFSAIKNPELCTTSDEGEIIPYRFSLWNGDGISDHLPVECIVSLH